MPDQLLSKRDVARMLKVAVVTVRRWRINRMGPEYVRCGDKVIRYRMESVHRWLIQRKNAKHTHQNQEACS